MSFVITSYDGTPITITIPYGYTVTINPIVNVNIQFNPTGDRRSGKDRRFHFIPYCEHYRRSGPRRKS